MQGLGYVDLVKLYACLGVAQFSKPSQINSSAEKDVGQGIRAVLRDDQQLIKNEYVSPFEVDFLIMSDKR